jgi:hypothetical protein
MDQSVEWLAQMWEILRGQQESLYDLHLSVQAIRRVLDELDVQADRRYQKQYKAAKTSVVSQKHSARLQTN